MVFGSGRSGGVSRTGGGGGGRAYSDVEDLHGCDMGDG